MRDFVSQDLLYLSLTIPLFGPSIETFKYLSLLRFCLKIPWRIHPTMEFTYMACFWKVHVGTAKGKLLLAVLQLKNYN